MSDERSTDWRNEKHHRTCRNCGGAFEGKYNSSSCPTCRVAIKKAVYARFKEANPDYWVNWQQTPKGEACRRKVILGGYRLTESQYESMLTEQKGCCAICGRSSGWKANGGNLVIDHCHRSRKVRGLLCPSCNRGLGQFEDSPQYLRSAAEYIQREIAKRENAKHWLTGEPIKQEQSTDPATQWRDEGFNKWREDRER